MLKWLWQMFVRYVIGYYVPPGSRPAPAAPPPTLLERAAGKIVVMQLVHSTDEDPPKKTAYLLEIYVHGLSEDKQLAYCIAKPNPHHMSLNSNWFNESEFGQLVKGIIGPIPEADRIDMATVLVRRTYPRAAATQPVAPRSGRRGPPRVQPTPPQAQQDNGPQLREIDLPPEPTPTEPAS